MWSFSAQVVKQRQSFSLSEWVSTFLPGFEDISRVCVPQLSSMAAIVSPVLVLDLPASGTNLRLFWPWGHKQCGPPTLHSCTLPLSGPWVLRRDSQTEHCVRRRGVSLWVYPRFTVYTGNWAAMLAPFSSLIWPFVLSANISFLLEHRKVQKRSEFELTVSQTE